MDVHQAEPKARTLFSRITFASKKKELVLTCFLETKFWRERWYTLFLFWKTASNFPTLVRSNDGQMRERAPD